MLSCCRPLSILCRGAQQPRLHATGGPSSGDIAGRMVEHGHVAKLDSKSLQARNDHHRVT